MISRAQTRLRFLAVRSAETELAGLDIPEMGALGYPDFVLTAPPAEKATM